MASQRVASSVTGNHASAFEDLRSGIKMVHTNTGRSFRSHRPFQGKGPDLREDVVDVTTSNTSLERLCTRR